MTLKRVLPFALALSAALPAFSQVQLFEAEVSGLVPYAGVKWNSGITQALAGLEYNIDGRTSLGFSYAQPTSDTLSFDKDLHEYTINPYGIFEFIEPDNLKSFSFAIRADLIHEDTKEKPKGTPDSLKYNDFARTQIGGGPQFALRIFSSDKLAMIPSVGYELFYVTYHRNQLTSGGKAGNFKDGVYLWHNLYAGCVFHWIFNEFNGLSIEPKVVAKLGSGLSSNDLLNVDFNIGYVRAF